MSTSRQVDNAIARFDEVMGRIDRSAASRAADQRQFARSSRVWLHRAIGAAIAVGIVMVATTVIGVILNGVPRKGADANSYGYHYKSYYGSEPSPTNAAA